jgi:hypothetical protein
VAPPVEGEESLADAPNGVLVIDDFEGYESNDALAAAYAITTAGNTISFTLESAPENHNGGQFGMRADFTLGEPAPFDDAGNPIDAGDLGGPDYAGANLTIDQSWVGARAVRFWVKPDRPDRVVVVQFQESDGDYWELEYKVEGTEPYIAEITMDQFVVPPWYVDSGQPMQLEQIIQFSIYARGPAGTSVLFLDDFEVVSAEADSATTDTAGMEDAGDGPAIAADAGVQVDAGTVPGL